MDHPPADSERQALPPGRRLGPYEIVSRIGAGGMGEVYRARDLRLDREVAIKVLPHDRLGDEDRRLRFVQEARAASRLNHPNIVTIHEIESVDGTDFIVMEYIRGRSLDEIIPRQGMRLAEILRLAIPIADALATAHARGIVHRDVKPPNLMVTEEGVVKVLDFGLAKLVRPSGENPTSETATDVGAPRVQSRSGMVAGTLGYMSPEQAAAGPVDARSDVFSFGAVLYEMATGQRAFAGRSTAEVLAALMKDQPKAPSEVAPGLPRELDRVVQRCLQKDPARRFQHTLDVKLELEQIKQESDTGRAPARPDPRRGVHVPILALWTLAAVVSALVLVAAWRWLRRPPATPLPPRKLFQLTTLHHYLYGPTFSPDGQQVAFCWQGEKGDNWDIYVKMVDSPEVRRLTEGPEVDVKPRWSPDGKRIAFMRSPAWGASGRLHVMSALGGASRKVSDLVTDGALSWSPDGRWLAARGFRPAGETTPEHGGLYLVPIEGGEPRVLTRPAPPGDDWDPAFSPDGRRLAYSSCRAGTDRPSGPPTCDIFVLGLGPGYVPSGVPRRVTRQNSDAHVPVWTRDGGSIIYEAGRSRALFRVDASGDRQAEPIELAGFQARAPAVAPTGNRLAFVRFNENYDVYRVEAGRPPEPLLASSAFEYDPDYSPDGRRIAFISTRGGATMEVWLANADGTNAMQLTHGPGQGQGSPAWSPDGRQIAFDSQAADSHSDLWSIDPEGGAPRPLTRDPGDEYDPIWSRDGRWVYFTSDRSGAPEIWRLPAGGGVEERVTHGGASFSKAESADGKSLLFWREKDQMGPLVAHPLDGGKERTLVECVTSWTGTSFRVNATGIYYRSCGGGRNPFRVLDPATGRSRLIGLLEDDGSRFAVSPDGKTILFGKQTSRPPDLMMIENFQ